jgi:hypothetical protein
MKTENIMRYIMKIYLLSLLVFAFMGCSDNEKKPKAILGVLGLGKTTSSSNATANPSNNPESATAITNSASPATPTNPSGGVPATNANSVSSQIPIIPDSDSGIFNQVVTKYIIPFFEWQSFVRNLHLVNGNSPAFGEFFNGIPPEGIYIGRAIPIAISPNLDCNSLKSIPNNPTYNGEHIENITLWKKTGTDKWEYVPGYVKCINPLRGLNQVAGEFDKIFPYWFKAGDEYEKSIFYRDLTSLKKVNELWLDPNSTYRILISQNLKVKGNFKLSELEDWKFNPEQFSYAPLQDYYHLGPNATENNYYWAEFKTMPAPCFKTFYDFSGPGYTYYNQFFPELQSNQASFQFSFTPPEAYIPNNLSRWAFGDAVNIQLTGPALMNKTRLEVCGSVPELCIPNVNYYSGMSILKYLDTYEDLAFQNESNFLAQCIMNPGKENEYLIVYNRGNYTNKTPLKNQCIQKKGLWRNFSSELANHDFRLTRCSANSGTGGNGIPVCKAASGRLDLTQGSWYETPKEEILNPQNPNKKIPVSGIHTFWENQKLIYKVKANCKAGEYNLSILAKNIFGPLPSDFKTFKIKILNKKDGKSYYIEIKASDVKYQNGIVKLFLDKGDSDLEILWTNDAYKESAYDSNIQIKSVSLKLISELK